MADAGVRPQLTKAHDHSIQKRIDYIRSSISSEDDLLKALKDVRALVRANAIMELGRRTPVNTARVVAALRLAAHADTYANVRLLGSLTQRALAIATLAWLPFAEAQAAYQDEIASIPPDESQRIQELAMNGPIQ